MKYTDDGNGRREMTAEEESEVMSASARAIAEVATHGTAQAAFQAERKALLADIPASVNSVAELRVVVADLQAAVRILAGYEK
jgi:hypothetical protein